ncbi:MAG: hypothetical protein M5R36_25465 [Deltaproteobacteria bacterium]|nr:hypothetical protein [Deltaproteobacteria bacterium]
MYNKKRSGRFLLGRRRYRLRRVRFPARPSAEWYALDLINNADTVGVSLAALEQRLTLVLRDGLLQAERLDGNAKLYGTKRAQAIVERAIHDAKE